MLHSFSYRLLSILCWHNRHILSYNLHSPPWECSHIPLLGVHYSSGWHSYLNIGHSMKLWFVTHSWGMRFFVLLPWQPAKPLLSTTSTPHACANQCLGISHSDTGTTTVESCARGHRVQCSSEGSSTLHRQVELDCQSGEANWVEHTQSQPRLAINGTS